MPPQGSDRAVEANQTNILPVVGGSVDDERLCASGLAHSWSEFDGIQLPVVFYALQGVQAPVNEADS